MYGKYGADSLPRRGAMLFTEFERYHLTDQKRAKDKDHLRFLKRMSQGAKILMSDLLRYRKLGIEDLSSDFDIQNDKVSWKYAPILVADNRERIDIVARKAVLFAGDHETYTFRWKTDVGSWKNAPLLLHDKLNIQDSDPCFWQYFVCGADGFLTTNLNNNLGLANGTPVKLHSLTFGTDDQLQAVMSEIRNKPSGSVITLTEPPLAVNVAIPSLFDQKNAVSQKKKAQLDILQKLSVVKGETVIALPAMRSHTKPHEYTVHSLNGIGRVTTKEVFPYELAFGMTIHKAQGRTIPRVVLALAHRENAWTQMTYASIYVAMSRVKLSADMRIIYHDRGPRPGILGLKYVTNLRHCAHVMDYYAGFMATAPAIWDSTRSAAAKAARQIRI